MVMFKQMTTKELIQYIRHFKFTRPVTQWHIHHTWSPNYSHFKGNNHQQLQQGMKDYHVNTNHWQDIGQHFTLFPDGTWLLGRDLNLDPASITGWNSCAIAVEMLGNFDIGRDIMTTAQKKAIYEMSSFMTKDFGLFMKFHRDSPTAGKTCPGSGINREKFFEEVSLWKDTYVEKTYTVKKEEVNSMPRELKDWEKKVFNECLEKGIITDQSWKDKPDEKMDVVHVLSMLNNLYIQLNRKMIVNQ